MCHFQAYSTTTISSLHYSSVTMTVTPILDRLLLPSASQEEQ